MSAHEQGGENMEEKKTTIVKKTVKYSKNKGIYKLAVDMLVGQKLGIG